SGQPQRQPGQAATPLSQQTDGPHQAPSYVQALTPADYRPRPPDHCLFPCAATRQTNGLQATDAAEPLLRLHTVTTQPNS
ncbi:MAG: hypothetical protein ACK48R_18250, partial [Planctomyces sp.]